MSEGQREDSLRILQLMSCRGWSSDAWAAVSLTLGLQEHGHDVILVCREKAGKDVAEKAAKAGVRQIEFLSFQSGFRPATWRRDLQGLHRLMGTANIQILHAHRGQDHWLAATILHLDRGKNRPVAALIRSRHILQPIRTHLANRWLYNRATDHVVAATEKIQQGFEHSGAFRSARIITLRGGVDTRDFRPGRSDPDKNREKFGIPDSDIVFGMNSSFIRLKGHMTALEALALLRQRGLPTQLLLACAGGDQEKVARRAVEIGIGDAVHLLGFRNDLPSALSAADAGLFAAWSSEGTSRAVLEWMALGRPVVATDVGCVRELLHDGSEGLIVPPKNPAALANAMERLIRNPEWLRDMGRNARGRAEREYDRCAWTVRIVGVYRRALGLPAGAAGGIPPEGIDGANQLAVQAGKVGRR